MGSAVSAETWYLESCEAARLHIALGGAPGSTMDQILGLEQAHMPVLPRQGVVIVRSREYGEEASAIGGLITRLPTGRSRGAG